MLSYLPHIFIRLPAGGHSGRLHVSGIVKSPAMNTEAPGPLTHISAVCTPRSGIPGSDSNSIYPWQFFKVSEMDSHLGLIPRFLLHYILRKLPCFVPRLFAKLPCAVFSACPSNPFLLFSLVLHWGADLRPELLGSLDPGFPWLGQWITSAGDSKQERTAVGACGPCSLLLRAVCPGPFLFLLDRNSWGAPPHPGASALLDLGPLCAPTSSWGLRTDSGCPQPTVNFLSAYGVCAKTRRKKEEPPPHPQKNPYSSS